MMRLLFSTSAAPVNIHSDEFPVFTRFPFAGMIESSNKIFAIVRTSINIAYELLCENKAILQISRIIVSAIEMSIFLGK